jgi:hypothetical protein
MDDAETCLNCEHPLSGEYCARCGQRSGPARTTLRRLIGELVSETFELDGRVARTIVPFLIRPGFLTLEYNRGRRRSYTAPLRLFLAMGVLWVMSSFAIGQLRPPPSGDGGDGGARVTIEDPDDPGSLVRVIGLEGTSVGDRIQARISAFEALPEREQIHRVRKAAIDTLPTVALALLPLFTVFLKLLFLGSGRTIPEHAIFALHLHSFALLVFIVIRIGDAQPELTFVAFLGLALYTVASLRRAYSLRWFGTVWRSALLGIGALTVTVSVTLITVVGAAIAS